MHGRSAGPGPVAPRSHLAREGARWLHKQRSTLNLVVLAPHTISWCWLHTQARERCVRAAQGLRGPNREGARRHGGCLGCMEPALGPRVARRRLGQDRELGLLGPRLRFYLPTQSRISNLLELLSNWGEGVHACTEWSQRNRADISILGIP